MNWYLKVLKQCTDFSSRARRKEYWMFVLFNVLFSIVATILDIILGTTIDLMGLGIIYMIYSMSMIIPSLAVLVRRLHDVGKSGWMFLITLIPLVGPIWLLILLVKDSAPSENQYGLNPKEVSDLKTVSNDSSLSNSYQKFIEITAYMTGFLSIIILSIIIFIGDDAIEAGIGTSSVEALMKAAYLVLGFIIFVVVSCTIFNLISNLAAIKNTLIFTGVFFAIALFCYFIASGTEITLKDGSVLTQTQSKLVGAGLYLFYTLAFVAGGTMLFFGVKKSLNK